MTLDRFFGLSANNTSVRVEALAGVTTFLTMAYIMFVQPAALSAFYDGKPTGMDPGAVLLATCVSSALATLIMGLYANYPIALAPGMGENFFFVSVIGALAAAGVAESWRVALGIVMVAGVAFFVLSALKVRRAVIDSMSPSFCSAVAAGIGLFIAFIGLKNGGVIVDRPGTFIGLSADMASPDVAIFMFGLVVCSVLQVRRVRGAILLGIIASAVLAVAWKQVQLKGFFGLPEIKQHLAFNMSLRGGLSWTAYLTICLPFVVMFLFMDMFDTVGTLVGVAKQAGLMKNGELPRADRALMADSAGTVIGACMGTSTVTSYIESAAGVQAGGRTGLTAVVTGALFLAALLFSPFVTAVGQYLPVTAPALVVVGCMMLRNAASIDWDDYSEAIPAFLCMIGIPLTFSIADGLALGFISYPVIKLLSGRGREVKWMMYLFAAVMVLYFVAVR